MIMNKTVGNGMFSIGHSNQSIENFANLLQRHRIDVLADVRSAPYSRYNPQFNKRELATYLENEKIRYAFFGKELGARTDDLSCYVDGQVRYARLAARDDFRQAIGRLIKGANDYRIALMCAEKEPLECHRTILVSQALFNAGCAVRHIHIDGSLEAHEAALERLLDITGVSATDMFRSRKESLEQALAMQESRIAYRAHGTRTGIV